MEKVCECSKEAIGLKRNYVIEIKKNYEDAQLPTRGSDFAAGYDLYAYGYDGASGDWTLVIPPNTTVKIDTGISVALPVGYFGAIYPRSGMATKFGLAPANKVGVVDADYRGPIIVALHNHSDKAETIGDGERIAQIVFTPFMAASFSVVDELDDTERGAGGFGSTGTK